MPPDIYDPCHRAGGMTAFEWKRDPKRIGFILARYKFVAKMLEGMEHVMEVGCSDGFGARVVRQHVKNLWAVDIDPLAINEAMANMAPEWPIHFSVEDFVNAERQEQSLDAIYALDVLEHIDPVTQEHQFLENMRCRAPVAIIGMPSLESQEYASELSKEGHINCKTGPQLRDTLLRHWAHVFMFGMNDETLHTGFMPMAQYRLALCTP